MSTKRNAVAVIAANGLLYAVGGNDGKATLASVERYDPVTAVGSPVTAMGSARAGDGVACL